MVLWDPLGVSPVDRRWVWGVLALLVVAGMFSNMSTVLKPRPGEIQDFFQEWSSARNLHEGLPIYTNHRVTIPLYLEQEVNEGLYVEVNAHPPTSVLLAIPFAALDYRDAALAWNLVSLGLLGGSLWLIVRELRIRVSLWALLPAMALLPICGPLLMQLLLGQLNLILLLLLTGVWIADRSDRPRLAGAILGAATAIKIFPGFLLLYFLLRRRWGSVLAWIISVLVLTAITALILGPETYRSYIEQVLPEVGSFRSGWSNASLIGFWAKLFDPATKERIVPLWHSPILARLSALVSISLIMIPVTRVILKAQSRHDLDHAFGLSLTAMLLVSPISWAHYLILLVLPIILVWAHLGHSGFARVLFLLIMLVFWVPPGLVHEVLIPGGIKHGVIVPLQTILLLSYQCYVLLILLALGLSTARMVRAERGVEPRHILQQVSPVES